MIQTNEVLRTEKKYSITPFSVPELIGDLEMAVHPDAHNIAGGYLVRSLYFDTPFDDDYEDKVDGLLHRRKIRLRTYSPDADTVKLEIKEKMGALQRKRSLGLTRAQAQRLIAADYSVLEGIAHPLAQEFYRLMTLYTYRPVCIVEYYRTAFIERTNDTRVTIDQQLASTESNYDIFDSKLMTSLVNEYPIMEVKYNGFLLDHIKNLARITGEIETANSKYVMARQGRVI